MPGAKPSYHDISAIYFRSEGVTEPVAVRRGHRVQRGACPVTVALYVSLNDVAKGGGPACLKSRFGEVQHACCGATDSTTEDSPPVIFDRLLAVLEKDHFYDIAPSSQTFPSNGAALYLLAVMRCAAQPHDKNISIAFVGTPQAKPNTSILALSIPFGSLAGDAYDSKILMLFADFTRAVYQSQWTEQDIW
ncbi:MAG TPA: hypothetical protein VGG51_10280 [Candidatus Cybelea sp.]